MIQLCILHRNDDLVAIEKPAGMLVHPTPIAPGEGPTCTAVLGAQLGLPVYPVHRLDRAASGVMVFGLHAEAARMLTEAFTRREVHKTYWAVVRGHPPETDRIEHPLREEIDRYEDRRTDRNKPPQEAVTTLRRLAKTELPIPVRPYDTSRYALVELSPETGRKHQLRRHMKHRFHPIIGDTNYGDGPHNRMWREQFELRRLMLFAMRLEVMGMRFEAGLPEEVRGALEEVGLLGFLG